MQKEMQSYALTIEHNYKKYSKDELLTAFESELKSRPFDTVNTHNTFFEYLCNKKWCGDPNTKLIRLIFRDVFGYFDGEKLSEPNEKFKKMVTYFVDKFKPDGKILSNECTPLKCLTGYIWLAHPEVLALHKTNSP